MLDDADLALARGQTTVAERGYVGVLEARPGSPRALAGLARVALAAGDLEAALDYDDRAWAGGGAEVPGHLGARERCALWLAVAEARVESQADRAADLLGRIEAEPACPRGDLPGLRARILLAEARAAHAREDLEAALVACRLAIEADAALPDADLAAARWLLDAGRRRDALAWLGVALERHPDDVGLQRLMLEALGVPEP